MIQNLKLKTFENIDLFKSVDDEWEEIANADTSFDDDDLLLDN